MAPNADGTRDERLPRPGHAIVRRYMVADRGETLRVTVLSTGFEFVDRTWGERYDSLSAATSSVRPLLRFP